jgi:hypothetical protein
MLLEILMIDLIKLEERLEKPMELCLRELKKMLREILILLIMLGRKC